ncbi:MAG: hypothetical protein JW815_02655 [Candidatus Bathyarchaeota archaeon]|nr:hypothetical protein [Candidatus Bathyarchaeum sp.]
MGDGRTVLFLTSGLILLLLLMPCTYSSETNENEKLYEFLSSESPAYSTLFSFMSDVIQLDLTTYGVIPPENPPPGFEDLSPLEYFKQLFNYTSTLPTPANELDPYGGLAEKKVISPDFGYNGTSFGTMAMFVNEHMPSLKLYYYGEEDYIYSEPQPTDIVGRAKGILERYQIFFKENYGKDAPYIAHMLDMLNSNDDLSLPVFSEGNLTFRFSQTGDKSRIQWIYTEDDVEIEHKSVSIKFRYNSFESFHDTWALYNVSGLNTISFKEGAKLVVEAAQKGELRRTLADPGTGYVNISELVDTQYSVSLIMSPFHFDDYSVPSKISRDPFTIYPFLHIYFYFKDSPTRLMGLELSVWGDTGEIRYCTDVGKGFSGNGPIYDTNDLIQELTSAEQNPEESTDESPDPSSEEQNQDESNEKPEDTTQLNILNPVTLGVVVTLVAVPAISILVLALKRKKENLDKQS